MLAKSLVATLLSVPATLAVIGLLLAVTPTTGTFAMPLLLMVFPAWLAMTFGSFLVPETKHAAALLVVVTVVALAATALLKYLGLALV